MPEVTDKNGRKAIRVCGAVIVWDSLTQPDKNESGGLTYKLKLAIPAGNPAIAEIEQLAQQCLQQSRTFNGTLPPGANWAGKHIAPGEFNDMFPGGYCINPSTKHVPLMFNDQMQELKDTMAWMPLIYPGQSVDVLVDCWEYNNKSKGIATGLNGVCINLAAGAQRQQFGSGGGFNAASVFGGGGAAQPMAQPAGQPMQQQGQPMQQQGQPMQQQAQPMQQQGQPMQQQGQPMQQQAQPMQQQAQPMQQQGQPMQQQGQPMQQPMQNQQGLPMPQQNAMQNQQGQQQAAQHAAQQQQMQQQNAMQGQPMQHAAPEPAGQPLQQSTNFLPQ